MLYRQDWDKVKEIYEAWWNRELDYPLLQVVGPKEGIRNYKGYDEWGFLRYKCCPREVIDLFEETCKDTYFGGEAFPNLWLNLGPGSLASYFTGFLQFDEDNSTVWFEYPLPWEEVERLGFKEDNEWWQYTKYIAKLSAERAKDKFIIGNAGIGSGLDILSSLRGAQNLLIDLIEEPERVLYANEKILKAWFKTYEELYSIISATQEGISDWMSIWYPKRGDSLQCDFSYMISPKMFERFVAPYLERQCKWLDYSIYHLDGPGEILHLDILLEIPDLDGIQWVPGDGNPQCDSQRWFPMYRKILSKNKLLVLQSFDDKNSITKIFNEIPCKGTLISIWSDSEINAREFLKSMRRF